MHFLKLPASRQFGCDRLSEALFEDLFLVFYTFLTIDLAVNIYENILFEFVCCIQELV